MEITIRPDPEFLHDLPNHLVVVSAPPELEPSTQFGIFYVVPDPGSPLEAEELVEGNARGTMEG